MDGNLDFYDTQNHPPPPEKKQAQGLFNFCWNAMTYKTYFLQPGLSDLSDHLARGTAVSAKLSLKSPEDPIGQGTELNCCPKPQK